MRISQYLCAVLQLKLVTSFVSLAPMSRIANSELFAERRRSGGRGSSNNTSRGRRSGGNHGRGRGGGSDSGRRNTESQSIEEPVATRTNYDFDDDPFGDYDDGDMNFVDDGTDGLELLQQNQEQQSSHFFSKKALSDPNFSIESETFQDLCTGAGIDQPSRIQALAWPALLKGESNIVADQTGSGKTLSYLLPLLQRMMSLKEKTVSNKKEYGSPKVLILAPTAELADQIKLVCDKTTSDLSTPVTTRVITATGSHSTNIRDQIRMLGQSPVDILISTPGRVATILRTKSTTLNLSNLQAIVLDEVDVLLIDDTFGPQLRTIGAASPVAQVQFVFVTATLPNEIIESVKREFKDVGVIQGPGLHRVAPNLKEHLVDVSVPSTENKNLDLCFEFKAKELMKALRSNRCKRTLVFCNTVETCRKVENLIKRSDRRGRVFGVGAYHNAMTPESRRRNLSVFAKGLDREVKAGRKEVVDHVLVCTERAARGVDFDAAPVNHVVIFDFPKDPAEYVRRVGRTARAGRSGTSTVFAFAWQLPIARKIMGSKLESYTVAAEQFGKDEDAEYSQKQRQRSKKMQDQMIRGNIEKGVSWK
eukprot:scaffold11234_cov246-Chaetoceros_neogracile.AAC.1